MLSCTSDGARDTGQIGCREYPLYELARNHLDLAALPHTQDNHVATVTHLHEAYALFSALRVPKWTECTAEIAGGWEMPLTVDST